MHPYLPFFLIALRRLMIIFNIKVSPTVQDQSRVNRHSTCVLKKSATDCAFHKRFPDQGYLLFYLKGAKSKQ